MSRSTQQELLDKADLPFEDICQNMKELDFINTWLGGHTITIAGLKKILPFSGKIKKNIHICEIGCGGGDNLWALYNWCVKNNIPAYFTGIDKKEECLNFAMERNPNPHFTWINSDYNAVDFTDQKPDIIFSSLFCHHFSSDHLIQMMQWMKNNSKLGFFINDLHRNSMAYYLIKWLTTLFSKSYLVKHDAPLSVRRGFIREDWQWVMHQAGIYPYALEWKWAFRWLLTVRF